MNKYLSIMFSAIFFLIVLNPCQVLAASIKEKQAEIGYACTASGDYSTAMGKDTTASGIASTAMGLGNKASGGYSTAMGTHNTAGGAHSFAGGRAMILEDTADHTFVWGWSSSIYRRISTANAFLIFPAGTVGRVGIGTPSPGSMLHVKGNGWPESFLFLDTHGVNQDSGIRFYENASVKGHLYHDAANDALRFFYEGHTSQLALKSNGRVGIGTINPGALLEVNGGASKPGGGSWSVSSDERLKDITGVYEAGLNKILGLKPVTFFYKDNNSRNLPTDEEYIGFIAQEVQAVFPEAVSEGKDGYLDFNMHPVNVALVNAVKELKVENDALRQEIKLIKAALGL